MEFVHLHNHTHFSLLDAAATVDELLKCAQADNQKALALTDHGVMFGCLSFYKKAKDYGVKPILGMEAYMANGSRLDKSARTEKKKNYFHLLLLAKNHTGYKNLMKLTSIAHIDGMYYKPRIDFELLQSHSEGLICTSACLGGVVASHLLSNDYQLAKKTALEYKELFGDDFYLEIQDHKLSGDKIVLEQVPILAKELGIKLVATNDIHYIKKEHAVAHNVLLNIRDATAANSGTFNLQQLRYGTPEYYFRSQKEMIELFKDFPEAIESTVEIADKCDLKLDLKSNFMPVFPIPITSKSTTLDEYLRELSYEGMHRKIAHITPEITDRIDFELSVIKNMGFPGYFLIVADFIKAGRDMGVRVGPGRGSAAGSLVAYCLDITNINPLEFDLLFERFLNPDRVSMPDIDIDFADDKREMVIEYVKQKYGENAVAMIITYGKLSSKAVLTDVARVIGYPQNKVKEITKKIPVKFGKVFSVKDAIEIPELRWVKESDDPKVKELLEYSMLLENKNRSVGTHAAGVVIAPGDITDYVPLYKPSKVKEDSSIQVATQYDGKDLESAGLLKMDFLGLRTLSIIENSLTMIKNNHDIDIDIDAIDFTDKKTYDMMSDGNTQAVFQFESPGMQEYLRQLKPQNLEEITAMNALYRPGPMSNIPDFIDRKFGRKPVEYLHPIMSKSLQNTYGIIVYQEQVMRLVQDIAGFTLAQADELRRAMGKKNKEIMEKMMPKFIEGAAIHNISKKLAEEIYDLIYKFADYGFNKSHSVAYSYLAFQTAWLKTHYPSEFLAANMTAELNDQAKIVALIDEGKKFNINVLPPDVNKSMAHFVAFDKVIFFGMAGIKNVGVPAVESIVKARIEKPFTSLFDFCARVDTRLVNKRALEALVCSGAFDNLKNGHRAALFASIENAIDYAKRINEVDSAESLFGGFSEVDIAEPSLYEIEEWTDKERLEKEKEYLNFYISGHPLERYKPHAYSFSTFTSDVSYILENNIDDGRFCGLVTNVRTRIDGKQNTIAFVQVEDFRGKIECIFWSDAFSKYQSLLVEDVVLVFSGKISVDEDSSQIKMVVREVMSIEDSVKKLGKGYKIWIDLENPEQEVQLEKVYNQLWDSNVSDTRIIYYVYDNSRGIKKTYFSDNSKIKFDDANCYKLMKVLGADKIQFLLNY